MITPSDRLPWKLTAFGLLCVGGFSIAWAFSRELSPIAGTERIAIAVVVTAALAWLGLEVSRVPAARRQARAQAVTDRAVRALSSDPARAAFLFAEAAALHRNQRTLLNYACALHVAGQLSLAREVYQEVAAPGGHSRKLRGEALVELSRLSSEEEDWEWAATYASQALAALPDDSVNDRVRAMIERAHAQWRMGHHDLAHADIDTALGIAATVELQRAARSLRSMISVTDAARKGVTAVFDHLAASSRIQAN